MIDIQAAPAGKEYNSKGNNAYIVNPEQAVEFTKKLNIALTQQAIVAAEHAHKEKFKEDKHHIENGKGMEEESETDLVLEEKRLKRKLKNIIIRQQQKLGLT